MEPNLIYTYLKAAEVARATGLTQQMFIEAKKACDNIQVPLVRADGTLELANTPAKWSLIGWAANRSELWSATITPTQGSQLELITNDMCRKIKLLTARNVNHVKIMTAIAKSQEVAF